jgi:hypothetical protein
VSTAQPLINTTGCLEEVPVGVDGSGEQRGGDDIENLRELFQGAGFVHDGAWYLGCASFATLLLLGISWSRALLTLEVQRYGSSIITL